MVIYFMRHTAVDVPQGVCYGQTDVPLKPTFEMEATQTAAHLQGLSFDKVSTMPEYQKVYAQGTNGKYSPYASTSWGPLISELPNDPTYGGNTDNEFTKQYGKHEGMYYVPQRAAAGLDPWAQPQAYDNIKDFFNVGTTWSNSVNVAQSFDKGNYSFSIGNTTSDGSGPLRDWIHGLLPKLIIMRKISSRLALLGVTP